MVILDTSIVIDHLRQSSQKDTILQKIAREVEQSGLGISVITVQELYEGRSTQRREIEVPLLATISSFQILPYTFEIAQKAGMLARDSKRTLELADAAIAATAIQHGAKLATLNRRDFQGIPELEFMNAVSL